MLGRMATAFAAAMMVASPSAAQMANFEHPGTFRPGATVGAYFRLPLEREGGNRVAAVRDQRDWPAAPVQQADALDLRLIGNSRPTLLIAGRPAAQLPRERLNLSTGATVAIVAGGAVLLLLVAAAAAGPGFPDCAPVGGQTDHCIDP
jgi:hypothetical protein